MKKKSKTKNFSKEKKLKALVLFSGGLDSRLCAKILEEQEFEVHLCFVKLPFGGGCCNNFPCIINFSQTSGFQLHIIDATKGKLFNEYLELTKKPKHGVGASANPCKDCKIFIFKQGKKLAKKIDSQVIVTGEVLAQRPMSQMKSALMFNDERAGLKNKILRPLSAKLLPETIYEKKRIIDRKKLFEIHGRQRTKQIQLAKKYKIKHPDSGGGCLLCEKEYGRKLKFLFNYKEEILFEEILLLNKARMFKGKGLIFIGRNESENLFIEEISKKIKWNFFKREDIPGPTIVFDKKEDLNLIGNLWEAYSKGNLKERKNFEKFRV